MNIRILIVGFAVSALASFVQGAESERLFAAVAMTKQQEASPLPTDSGVFIRDRAASEWERVGPVIQSMNSISNDPSDPSVLFMACGNGIVRSLDAGENWRLTTGWRESDVLKVAVDPHDGSNVFAASVWGVSASRDGGETWSHANRGLKERYSRTVIVDHRNPRRLILGTADGIYESANAAKSWTPVRSSPKLIILRIARSEANADLWIAGTEGQGVYLSRNDGKLWQSVAPELGEENVYAVAADPLDASRLAVGGWETGVWFSADAGASWKKGAGELPSENITAMTFDKATLGRLWASTFEEGTYYSDDFGQTWRDGGLYGAYVYDLGYVTIRSSE